MGMSGVQVYGLGLYGRRFRGTHGKYRKLENIQHPRSRFTFSEESFLQTYCDLLVGKPTPEEAFYNNQAAFACEDHRLKI